MRKLWFTSPYSLAIVATVIFGLSFIWGSPFSLTGLGDAEAIGSAADAMTVDMDPTLTPANTVVAETGTQCTNALDDDSDGFVNDGCASFGTAPAQPETVAQCANATDDDGDGRVNDGCTTVATLGTVEPCITATAGSNVTFDITVTNIPTTNLMSAFVFVLNYPTPAMSVTAADTAFLLGANAGSSLLAAGDESLLPDTDGSFAAGVADTGSAVAAKETGSGVLERLTITIGPGTSNGVYDLTLDLAQSAIGDQTNTYRPPDAVFSGKIAVGVACPLPPLPPVDIELVSLSLTSVNPITPAGTNFALTVQATANNNGPNPADIRFDLGIAAPGDCALTPPGNQTEDFLNVLPTQSRTSTQVWTANCSTPSTHIFSGSGTVTVIGLADESTPANNGPLADPETVAITGDADVKVTGVVVDAPPDAATGAPFAVNVTATLHNNGPLTPVNVDTTINLQVPVGCTRLPNISQLVGNTSLALSTPVNVVSTWTVSCTTTGLKTFTGTASAAIDQLHTTDPNMINNDGQGQDTTDTSLGVADVKVTTSRLPTERGREHQLPSHRLHHCSQQRTLLPRERGYHPDTQLTRRLLHAGDDNRVPECVAGAVHRGAVAGHHILCRLYQPLVPQHHGDCDGRDRRSAGRRPEPVEQHADISRRHNRHYPHGGP